MGLMVVTAAARLVKLSLLASALAAQPATAPHPAFHRPHKSVRKAHNSGNSTTSSILRR
jgi:hypothetical protein